jgi:uncharacterized protein (DUF983 family)
MRTTLTKIQQKLQKSKCPACGEGRLHRVDGENEIMLWCNQCSASIDSDGGLIR